MKRRSRSKQIPLLRVETPSPTAPSLSWRAGDGRFSGARVVCAGAAVLKASGHTWLQVTDSFPAGLSFGTWLKCALEDLCLFSESHVSCRSML